MKKRIILIVSVVAVVVLLGFGVYHFFAGTGDYRLLSRASLAIKANKYQEAIEFASRYIQRRPDDWQGYNAKAKASYTPASELTKGLPQGLDQVIAKALAPDPRKRCPSVEEFWKSLKRLTG